MPQWFPITAMSRDDPISRSWRAFLRAPSPPPAYVPYHPKLSHPVPWLRDQAEGHNPKMTKRNGISVALQNLCFNHQPGLQGRSLYVKPQRLEPCASLSSAYFKIILVCNQEK